MQYGVNDEGLIDYDEVERLALEHKPKMIVAGFSAYSQVVDWARFRAIADKVGAYLFVDMAHVAGLVAAGVYPNPVPHAHVVTSTTHKTLRGPRGGIILAKANEEIEKKLQSIVFPGIQGGPLMHVIAAKAVAFKEALEPEFKAYQQQVVKNAQAMAKTIIARGYKIVSGGTAEPPDAGRHDRQGRHRQGRGSRAGQGPHHRQQERGAERPAQALRHLRPAHRHPGGHHPRLQGSRLRGAGRLDLRRAGQPERRQRSSPACATNVTQAVRAVPGVRLTAGAMHCPFCQHSDTRVIDSRVSEDGATIRRRRECEACGERFSTLETIELKLPAIIKSDGRREAFDARKLRVGFDRALQKRPVSEEQIEAAVRAVVHQLRMTTEREIAVAPRR